MPELPEVETIRAGLSKKITGLKITKVENINGGQSFDFAQDLQGRKVLKVWRKAKVLGIDLDDGFRGPATRQPPPTSSLSLRGLDGAPRRVSPPKLTLLFHLKMTGQLILIQKLETNDQRLIGGHPTKDMGGELPNKSTRVVFSFGDGSILYFNDQRKFGWIKLVKSTEVINNNLIKSLGPEPLEKSFSWETLKQNMLKHKGSAVKVVLLDQSVVSGIGNIYASEACFLSKIDPRKKVGELKDGEFQRLHQGIVEALSNGIKYGGSSRTHYVNVEGKKGRFLDFAFVYNREGEMCKICGGRVDKIKLGGRGTFLCPRCQKSQD